MSSQRRGRHSSVHRRAWLPWAVLVVVIVATVCVIVAVRMNRPDGGSAATARGASGSVTSDPAVVQNSSVVPNAASRSAATPASSATLTSAKSSATPTSISPTSVSPTSLATTAPAGPPPVLTAGGMWWGVDSSGPITAGALQNVAGWYLGAPRPQFWGRYIGGDYTVDAAELAFARSQHIYVYLIVNDRNCSECAGGSDLCGNDTTAAQARADALEAVGAAKRVGVPDRTVLYKDIEQVSSCRNEPTATYLVTWYQVVASTRFRTGFYGNVHQPTYDFPRGYCAAVALSPTFARDVVLDMNEDEPQLGARRGTVGPRNAPAFAPLSPPCASKTATKIWQYGESTDRDNYTDIDQARPNTPGMLAPDGSVTP